MSHKAIHCPQCVANHQSSLYFLPMVPRLPVISHIYIHAKYMYAFTTFSYVKYYVCNHTHSCQYYVCTYPHSAILIHTSCVCTVTAHLACLILYNNLFLEFSLTAITILPSLHSPILQRLAATLERALKKYPKSSSGPTICQQKQYTFEYTKLTPVLV